MGTMSDHLGMFSLIIAHGRLRRASALLSPSTAPTAAVTSATSGAHTDHHSRGVALCVLSAFGFGLMAIFAKDAYDAGISVITLLMLRFAARRGGFWAIVAARRARSALPARAARCSPALALGADRLRRAVRPVLRRAGAHRRVADRRCCSTPTPRWSSSLALALRPRARRPPAHRARSRSPAPAPRSCCSAAALGALERLGVAMALGAAVAYPATSWSPTASSGASTRSLLRRADRHRRGRDVLGPRRPDDGGPAPRRRRRRLGGRRRRRRSSPPWWRSSLPRRPASRRRRDRLDRLDRRARRHRLAGHGAVRRAPRRGQVAGGALCSPRSCCWRARATPPRRLPSSPRSRADDVC